VSRDLEKAREKGRRYYWRHRDEVLARDRAWYAANREAHLARRRAAYAANREAEQERGRRWRAANPEKVKQSQRRSRQKHAGKRRETTRAWRAANPARVQGYQQDRKARGGELRYAHGMRLEDWWAMWAAQRGRCYLCGESLPADRRLVAIDHDHGCCPPNRSCARCRRGLAHVKCNTLIGQAGDDPARLRLIARNLARAQRRQAAAPGPVPLAPFDPPEKGTP
jgi:hypothetical protein